MAEMTSDAVSGRRLPSLDILRGLNMFMIEGAQPLIVALLVVLGFSRDCALARQFEHVPWHGFHFEDFIYPLFVFISGTTWPFSLKRQREKGVTAGAIAWKIVKRMLLLVALGMFYSGVMKQGIHMLHWSSIIGRLGVCWAIAALLYAFCSRRAQIAAFWGVLVGYWIVLLNVAAPGAPAGADPLSIDYNLIGWLDPYISPVRWYSASVVPMVSTALAGMFAGEYLSCRREGLTEARRTVFLAAAGVGAILLGLVWAYGLGPWCFPLNKILWSSSLVLVTAGLSAILLAVLHWIVDVRGYERWGFFFRVIGMNAILLYVGTRSILPFRHMRDFVFGGLMSLLPSIWADVLSAAGYIACYWTVLYFFYRKGIFLKV